MKRILDAFLVVKCIYSEFLVELRSTTSENDKCTGTCKRGYWHGQSVFGVETQPLRLCRHKRSDIQPSFRENSNHGQRSKWAGARKSRHLRIPNFTRRDIAFRFCPAEFLKFFAAVVIGSSFESFTSRNKVLKNWIGIEESFDQSIPSSLSGSAFCKPMVTTPAFLIKRSF